MEPHNFLAELMERPEVERLELVGFNLKSATTLLVSSTQLLNELLGEIEGSRKTSPSCWA